MRFIVHRSLKPENFSGENYNFNVVGSYTNPPAVLDILQVKRKGVNRSIMPGAFPCPVCGNVYKWRKNMRAHLKLAHEYSMYSRPFF